MCGMRPNADKLVAFCRGLDFLIGVEEVGENPQMLEKSCLSFRFGFILILQNYKQQMQTWSIFVEHLITVLYFDLSTSSMNPYASIPATVVFL